jgi:hypothetical protein
MVAALTSIGPAVFNGGISTLIAIIMLISSQSHVFISYFKVSFVNIFISIPIQYPKRKSKRCILKIYYFQIIILSFLKNFMNICIIEKLKYRDVTCIILKSST